MDTIEQPQYAKTLTFFIIAGEESGDVHGARLVQKIKELYPNANFIGHGGDKMANAGVKIIEHISKLSLVGFTEIIKHLPYMRMVMKDTVARISKIQPDRIILIDYPGFNLRLAKKVSALNIPITYFILPQVWAWKENRINHIKNYIDQSISIIPFEQKWFKQRGMDVEFVGHPFAETEKHELSKLVFFKKQDLDFDKPLLTLLPGSRQQEIDRHLPVFREVIQQLKNTNPGLQFIIGKAPNIILTDLPDFVKIENDNVRLTMKYGTAALVASGTATLEAALSGIPMTVCYKASAITGWIAKRLTKVEYLSLVNLIAGRELVPEFLQENMRAEAITLALIPLLSETLERKKMISELENIKKTLGDPGVYNRTAEAILSRTIGDA